MLDDLRCTQCGKLLGRKMDMTYGEIKCPKCGAINIVDYSGLDKPKRTWENKIKTK